MKKQEGITLAYLVIYIAVMLIVITTMSAIIANFYNNTDRVQGDIEEIIKFNKFNNYFVKEVKANNNKVDTIKEDKYILFSSGNSFSFSNNAVYFNNIEICDKVKSMQIKKGKDGDGIDNTIVYIKLEFEKFKKAINYKIENIY